MTTQRTTSGIDALREATGDKGYDDLDDGFKATLSHKEWQWLSDGEKVRYVQNATEPEAFDDGI